MAIMPDNKLCIFLKLVLVSSFFVMMSNNVIEGIGFEKGTSTLECNTVYGALEGDTCTSVTQKFNLNPQFFLEINPNINCETIFVSQWLCLAATQN
ncbi:Peptidoglycan-binding lysin domain [Quillaja saponaria]|uniref:Peptidoglycan-binding lysin domain n=1 Tax=Quillaja saponaria TaxID=32244 RepID=A0AAD7M407_QUISA|nr:Peptidoglycan-binding lysin domain [Quillaja saponaria]